MKKLVYTSFVMLSFCIIEASFKDVSAKRADRSKKEKAKGAQDKEVRAKKDAEEAKSFMQVFDKLMDDEVIEWVRQNPALRAQMVFDYACRKSSFGVVSGILKEFPVDCSLQLAIASCYGEFFLLNILLNSQNSKQNREMEEVYVNAIVDSQDIPRLNSVVDRATPLMFVILSIEKLDEEREAFVLDSIKLLLEHGADPDIFIASDPDYYDMYSPFKDGYDVYTLLSHVKIDQELKQEIVQLLKKAKRK